MQEKKEYMISVVKARQPYISKLGKPEGKLADIPEGKYKENIMAYVDDCREGKNDNLVYEERQGERKISCRNKSGRCCKNKR